MNKKELSHAIRKARGCTMVEAKGLLNMFMEVFTEQLVNDNSINLQGFGILEPWHQTPRRARNPHTGNAVTIQARTSVKFRPGKLLLEALTKKINNKIA